MLKSPEIISDEGDLFFNVQHPSDANGDVYNRGTVGVLLGVNFNNWPENSLIHRCLNLNSSGKPLCHL